MNLKNISLVALLALLTGCTLPRPNGVILDHLTHPVAPSTVNIFVNSNESTCQNINEPLLPKSSMNTKHSFRQEVKHKVETCYYPPCLKEHERR